MGKEFPQLPDRSPWRVDFKDNDPMSPYNWGRWVKLGAMAAVGSGAFSSSFNSAIYSAGVAHISQELSIGSVPASLGVALYVIGFGAGPVVWGPASELWGRKYPIVLALFLQTCFNFAVATAENFQTIAICRFWAGFAGGAPISLGGGVIVDCYQSKYRGMALIVLSGTVFCGPMVAGLVGGYFVEGTGGWRWCNYLAGIMTGVSLVISMAMPESYGPTVLSHKAAMIREETGNWGVFAPIEEQSLDLHSIVVTTLARPLKMLVVEPILLLMTLYTAFVYGTLYMTLGAYPIIFGPNGYNFSTGNAGLPYIGLILGCVVCVVLVVTISEPMFRRRLQISNGQPICEARLIPMMPAAISLAVGIFWLTWSGNYHNQVHWIVPCLAGIPIGAGLLGVFLPALSYIIDCYPTVAASAISANTLVRSAMGGAFPLFTPIMFTNLGTNWAGLLVGLLATVLVPVPFLFYAFGERIRTKHK